MSKIMDKIKKKIFCRKHTISLSTKEKAQILADGVYTDSNRYSVIKHCKVCNRYYVIKKWTKKAKSFRKMMGIK